jgi:acyl-CoA synthetase (AMP-forming)/AMP-acid ligase II
VEFNLADLFESVVDRVPDRVALLIGDLAFSYRELDERANRVADHLARVGVSQGDHVGLQLFNGHQYVETMLGCFKLRAVPINVNYRYVADELAYLFRDAGLRALVHDARFGEAVRDALRSCPAVEHVLIVDTNVDCDAYESALIDASPARVGASRSGDDHYIIYTGGTTGMPKGVVWRHEDIFFAALGGGDRMMQGNFITSPSELAERIDDFAVVSLVAAPLMHGNAQWTTFGAFFGGGTVVLLPDGRLESDALRVAIEQHRVNVISLVGDAMAQPLIRLLEEGDVDTTSIIAIASGGAILSPVNKELLRKLVPHAMIVDGMGSSEAGVLGQRASVPGAESGPPRFTVNDSTAVFRDDGTRVDPGSGELGHLARSGHLPLGYHGDSAKTVETFRIVEGRRWVYTGDQATVDTDGTIVLFGRGSVSINTGGEKVFPEEVEAVLKGHPAVEDVVVVGVPDERWGERVVAVVKAVGDEPPTLHDLQAHCADRLARYKAPRGLRVVETVVRSPAGKPDYRWARDAAADADA